MQNCKEIQYKKFNVCINNDRKELFIQAIKLYDDDSLYIVDKGYYLKNGEKYFNEGYFSLCRTPSQHSDLKQFWALIHKLEGVVI
jgi:hypothetical protein